MQQNNAQFSFSIPIKLLLLALFCIGIIFPLVGLFSTAFEADVIKTLTSRSFTRIFMQTLYIGLTATCISVILGGLLAWALLRTKVGYKKLFSTLFLLPMLIPSVSHGIGIILLFGNNGIISTFLGIELPIYGFLGIVLGSVMYSLPVAYLMIADILQYEDATKYEAAKVLGLSPTNCFFALTMPYMLKPMISVVFAVFVMIITDYGVPLMVGGRYKTLATLMYQDVLGLLDFSKGALVSLVFLIPAIMAFVANYLQKEKGQSLNTKRPFRVQKRIWVDRIALVLCSLASCIVIMPILAFAFLSVIKNYPIDFSFSLEHIYKGLDMGLGKYLFNSIFIALATSFIGVVLALITAYTTTRTKSKYRYALHFFSLLTLTIPGIVLGLGYILFFKASPLYGTFAILILVNIMHFFASPYLILQNTFSKINTNIEAVSQTLGISIYHTIKDIILPQAKVSICETFSYFFVNSMITISAVSFLANVNTKPLSLMITQFEAHMLFEASAFVSLVILAINLLCKGIIYKFK